MNIIDYNVLGYAQHQYQNLGYQCVEVPWRVSSAIVNATCPEGCTSYEITGTGKSLLASGEQGFMYQMNKGMLPPGKYQTITPCFRNEAYDETHSKQFMKLELIEVIGSTDRTPIEEHVESMIKNAFFVFNEIAGRPLPLRIAQVQTEDSLAIAKQFDIEIQVGPNKWIEIGSYGARRAFFGAWIFGTGVAEPRFSKCLGYTLNLKDSVSKPRV